MRDYASYSFWLETCGDDLTPRPPLDGSIDVDVAILGAGYSGLWTGYYLLLREPSLKVAAFEREIAGYGASGRNGGWCSSQFPLSAGALEERFGREGARAVLLAMYDAVDEVGRVCAEEGIDAHYQRDGALEIARGRHQLPLLERSYAAYQHLGLGERYCVLDAEETAQRVRVTNALGSLFTPHCAALHPGRLVRGLVRAFERRGGIIYEQTEVTGFRGGARPRLETARGEVRAKTIVLAGEAYLTRLAPLHRQLLPLYSLIVLTEPLSEEQWAQIGWRNRETISSYKYVVDYLQKTRDGRILFGGRGEPYHLGSRIEDTYDCHGPTHRMIQRLVTEWFPVLQGVRFSHSWGGPVGMPRDWTPTVAYDREQNIATARGYTGSGVSTANLAGRILADLLTQVSSPLTELPFVGHTSPNWEPEPLRWLAVRFMQRAYERIDARAARTGQAPTGKSLVERLSRH